MLHLTVRCLASRRYRGTNSKVQHKEHPTTFSSLVLLLGCLGKAVRLAYRAKVCLVANEISSRIQRLHVNFQQVTVLHFRFEKMCRSYGCKAAGLFQQRAHHDDVGSFR